ncbi:MAG: hypothetical protein JST89_11190 [Cyanobacteria bacterium SZAS-4]|nr:hypothetical protein [Cyanobacteria bacterium SZAS-4]
MNYFERAQNWLNRLLLTPVYNPFQKARTGDAQEFATKYGITIIDEGERVDGVIKHSRVDQAAVEPACRLIRAELEIYTKRTVKSTFLKEVVLGSNVRHNDTPVGGLCVAHEGVLYFAADKLKNWNGSRRTFHHELFHCLDYHDDAWKYFDPTWAALNESNFKYSDQNKNKQLQSVPQLGFITNYAMTAVHEDKAELFAYMIVHHQTVKDMSENDPILRKKIDYLKALTKKACVDFNDSFWRTRLEHSVPPEHLRSEIPLSLRIWREPLEGAEMWLVARCDRPNAKPIAFYSLEQLQDALKKLGVAEFDEVTQMTRGEEVELKLKAARTVLKEIGLC